MRDGFEVAPDGVTAAATQLRERADELAKAGNEVGRLLQAMAAEAGGPATCAALGALRGVATEAGARLVAAVDALAVALHGAARRYVESDRLGR